eukprot:7662749-Alexandrium_andersonii.AAC.1
MAPLLLLFEAVLQLAVALTALSAAALAALLLLVVQKARRRAAPSACASRQATLALLPSAMA